MEKKNSLQLKWYLIVISICAVVTSFCVSIYYKVNFINIFLIMSFGIILVIIIDGITATIARIMPKKVADYNNKIFVVSRGEKNFYNCLKIKAWKEKVPEIGHFTGFRKNKVLEPKNPEYIKRFLMEICYGEIGHFASIFTGATLLLLNWFNPYWLSLCLVIVIVNAILNILPIMVLRYNSYSLLLIKKRLENKL